MAASLLSRAAAGAALLRGGARNHHLLPKETLLPLPTFLLFFIITAAALPAVGKVQWARAAECGDRATSSSSPLMMMGAFGIAARFNATSAVSEAAAAAATGVHAVPRAEPVVPAEWLHANLRDPDVKHDKHIEESKEEVYPRRVRSHDLPAKIRIVMKSFNNQKNNLKELEPYEHKIGLPESRSLYTVLRSPHIDKKSREQFSTHVKKLFVVKKAKTHELSKKFFWLKRLRILGAQYEIQISFKTRLDSKIGCSKGRQ